jgi:hypothetical protein
MATMAAVLLSNLQEASFDSGRFQESAAGKARNFPLVSIGRAVAGLGPWFANSECRQTKEAIDGKALISDSGCDL